MWSVTESQSERVEWPQSPPPPWPADVRATIWFHRATVSGRALLPASSIPVTMVMVVDYLSSPVGPYREILASPVLRRPGSGLGVIPRMAVPFIAVDSEESVHGGRSHWHLPKVMADFDGDVLGDFSATGENWEVRTSSRGIGPTWPIMGAMGFAQPSDSVFELGGAKLKGKARLCRVDVTASGPTLGSWVKAGTHFGLQIVSGSMSTGPATQVDAR
ncbi:acetoacetate decarboxylase family protein [Rhodococcus sp. I2R]|uniref:acetoacetate decarboxylase family protein n=1 Tax=Rhodococcus sp. I2R TaxID=2855445 RepID=UPI001E5DB8F8|nr:acetoacetate decarboxylase family protein [Rhodococcus sp. I2R]MCC8929197.1 acetoacetate decarboxylase family protein [Rhodococcus sp. I2R]